MKRMMKVAVGIVVVLAVVLTLILVPVISVTEYPTPCPPAHGCPPSTTVGLPYTYSESVSFYYFRVGAIYGFCGGSDYHVADARGGFECANGQFITYPTFITDFYYPISINYSGSWNLVYWGQNGTVAQSSSTIPGHAPWLYNIKGNLTGSGNYQTTEVTYGIGYVENMLCAKATKLDSQNLTLTLAVVGKANSTTASSPMAEVCATYAV